MTTGPAQLRCTATSIVDDSGCPSVLRVRVVDAAGRTWYLVDKEPVFRSGGAPLRERDLPAAVAVRCEVVETGPTGLLTVSTARPDAVEAEDGTTVFEVHRDQVDAGWVEADGPARWCGDRERRRDT